MLHKVLDTNLCFCRSFVSLIFWKANLILVVGDNFVATWEVYCVVVAAAAAAVVAAVVVAVVVVSSSIMWLRLMFSIMLRLSRQANQRLSLLR